MTLGDAGATHHSGRLNRARIIKAADAMAIMDAADIVEHARKQAEQILASAHQDASEIVEKAHARAQEILASTRAKAEAERKALLSEAQNQATREAVSLVNDAMQTLRAEIGTMDDLIIRLVERLMLTIMNEFEPSELLTHLVRAGIADLQEQFGLVLRVHPSDEAIAQEALARLREGNHTGIERVETSGDLNPGDYYLVSAGGLLDISLQNQLSNLIDGLQGTSSQRVAP